MPELTSSPHCFLRTTLVITEVLVQETGHMAGTDFSDARNYFLILFPFYYSCFMYLCHKTLQILLGMR